MRRRLDRSPHLASDLGRASTSLSLRRAVSRGYPLDVGQAQRPAPTILDCYVRDECYIRLKCYINL